MKRKALLLLMIPVLVLAGACTKEFLDKKPSKALLVPTTLSDFRALLDFIDDMNVAPGLNVISSDDFYRTDNTFISLSPVAQNTYLWAKDLYAGGPVSDWNKPYNQVFVANVVLDGLKGLKAGTYDPAEYNAVKGTAEFLRGFAFYGLAQEFAGQYDPATAAALPGIPIRLSADVNVIAGRGSLAQTYAQLLADIRDAASLLPGKTAFKNRPGKAAAQALLARAYLSMGDYEEALSAANSCLQLSGTLLDYNTLSPAASRPFPSPLPSANEEVLFFATLINISSFNNSSSTQADTALYNSYADNDLRKVLFFNHKGPGNTVFKGNYSGSTGMFAGMTTDEVYLVRAECFARKGDAENAIKDVNTLLTTRWVTGTFVPFTAAGGDDALVIILRERRKELVGRGLRWSDLRRLNADSRFAVTLQRRINGQSYELPPGSPDYTLPIPDNEIHQSGIVQNPRN